MSDGLRQLIKESIRLELNVSKIYLGFHHRFTEDADFWWKMAIEEESHAALLASGEKYFLHSKMFPLELICTSLDTLADLNRELECLIQSESKFPSSKSEAFNLAIRLEKSAGEIHFQHAMRELPQPSEPIKLFRILNNSDMDHADRIRSYIREKRIDVAAH